MAKSAAASATAPLLTVTLAGGNLFKVALDYLGDATQWNRIASLNGMSDPWFAELRTLQIPPVNVNAGGGILGSQ